MSNESLKKLAHEIYRTGVILFWIALSLSITGVISTAFGTPKVFSLVMIVVPFFIVGSAGTIKGTARYIQDQLVAQKEQE